MARWCANPSVLVVGQSRPHFKVVEESFSRVHVEKRFEPLLPAVGAHGQAPDFMADVPIT